ncbi:MAG: formylglycine-generating enzyme family protein [Planctomycetota bacterium]|nr:formylglycine-generating enzyme family protein [Planctomycetota bacterium]
MDGLAGNMEPDMATRSLKRRTFLRAGGMGFLFGSPLGFWCAGCSRPVSKNSLEMQFVQVPRGTFMMGASAEEDQLPSETRHRVTLTGPFFMGLHEVTQKQFGEVMGKNPSRRSSLFAPVDSVTWNEAVDFCERLSERPDEKESGYAYRLPTEAEWEFACRGYSDTPHSITSLASEDLIDYAWIKESSGGETHPVGEKLPNRFGIFDMHGNVSEWCLDWLGIYPTVAVTNPRGPRDGTKRVCRGGNYQSKPEDCRSATRVGFEPNFRHVTLGFRVVRMPRVDV